MKKILITAGGTATAWHFCQVISKYFASDYEIHIADINDEDLVPASIYAKKFHKVPPIVSDNYYDFMIKLLEEEKIDIIIPLIDFDLKTFSCDNKDLKRLNIISTAPLLKTVDTLSNKKLMANFLNKFNINTPKLYTKEELKDNEIYIVKPIIGFGSSGVIKDIGSNIKKMDLEGKIIQEYCESEEITAEIYNNNILKIFQRKRVATKSGVCVKMVPVYHEQINNAINKLVKEIPCPKAFCIQFMQNKEGLWMITDCNLRIGAGSALSTAIGFQLVRALLAYLLDYEDNEDLFQIDKEVKSVLRVYEEVVIK